MLKLFLSLLLAVSAGVSIVVQQILNANLRGALNSAAWSGFVSYLVGTVCMALLALSMRDPMPSASVAARLPWWAWSGGLFGAIFVALAILRVSSVSPDVLQTITRAPSRFILESPPLNTETSTPPDERNQSEIMSPAVAEPPTAR